VSANFDIFIIGGGVNGCGIARDAAGRGYSVALCEKNDLASGTSSRSTKLIHGGLRYLEHYEFRLVREALSEREILWQASPHIIWPLRFVLPHHAELRPKWLLRLGLFIYDHIGGRKKLPATQTLNLKSHYAGSPLKDFFTKGFEYSDCWVNDSRLVVLNARDAAKKGADIQTRSCCVKASRVGNLWEITTKNTETGEEKKQTARILVNASGPWIDEILRSPIGDSTAKNVRLVQGSHIVVPKMYENDHCYIFQNVDDRILFAIPYEQDFTLLGTTDRDFTGNIDNVEISDEEISYICHAASEYFKKPVSESDVVWSYSGVRPLFDDGASKAQEATRDYVLRCDGKANEPKVVNIFGGKITTYRRLAEAIMEEIETSIGKKGNKWTSKSTLPGGNFPTEGFNPLVNEIILKYPFMNEKTLQRMARAYGTDTYKILNDISCKEDLGWEFGADLTEKEVTYLMKYEWARTASDVVWRRSKLGLHMSEEQIAALDVWMKENDHGTKAATKWALNV